MAEPIKLPRDADSRLLTGTIRVSDPSGKFERTFCFICGKPQGWISNDSSNLCAPEHVIVTCDDCDARYGMLPLDQIPTDLLDAFGIIPEKVG